MRRFAPHASPAVSHEHSSRSRGISPEHGGVDSATAAAVVLERLLEQLRPSMVATLGFADLLRDPGLSPGGRDALLDRLGAAGRRVVRMLDTVTELHRITGASAPPTAGHCDLLSVLEDLLVERRQCIRGGGLDIAVRSEAAVPAGFVIDADRLRLAIAALLEDALAAVTGGRLELRIGFDPDVDLRADVDIRAAGTDRADEGLPTDGPRTTDEGWLRIDFVASGGDAAAESEPAESEIAAEEPPHAPGLGVVTARAALDRIGGQVTCRRTGRPGLRIGLRVPASAAGSERLRIDQGMPPERGTSRDPAAGTPLDGVPVVVAEGQPEPRWLLRAVLERSGAAVEEAADGPGLLEAISRGPVGVLLLSLELPGCEPRDLIGGLRHQGLGCPVIVMAAADPGELGDAWLPTPVDPAAVLEACVRWRGRRHESPPGSRD